ncbi:NCS2 family permease [Fumia xinanensis]|uniref:NCS2 family permease n=1 Tax=Fumia xinanensis TaxID=2763659 RepID=A0A926I2U3_9FIRM|nr:NCS2 family permease [Fumia xinanensis]MBC8559918.1 NCS2 family permease [Fumia xinanensis]
MEKFFKLKEHGTTARIEIVAGITTFVTMAYILVVNPQILGGGDPAIANGVFFATCISSFIGTILMALLARMPFAQAPGMGLNAFFAFTVMPSIVAMTGNAEMTPVEQYQAALALVFLSGLLFIVITVIGLREAIVRAIPKNVKIAISGGIGLFIAYLGLQNAGIVVANPSTQVGLVNFSTLLNPDTRVAVTGAIVAIVGLVVIAALYTLKVKGSILIGIVVSTLIAYLSGAASLPDGFSYHLGQQASDFVSTSFFKLDFGALFGGKNLWGAIATALVLILSFSIVDMFDTIGTLLGTADKAGLLDKDGNMPGMKKALLCDSIATTAGALLGTSTVTTYVESSAGIGEGGKTGMTSLTTAVLFLVALVLGPFIGLIPSCATAPALIFVGALMIGGLKNMEFDDMSEAVPGFLTVAMMPLTYSIANGIAFGLISHCLIKLCTGKIKETSIITWILAAFFILKFCLAG